MNTGVEVLNESVIRVQSQLNDWMNCVFVVSKNDEEKAREILEKAWDSFWEDGDGWCYGNYLEDKLINAGIAFNAYYADVEEQGIAIRQKANTTEVILRVDDIVKE